MRSRKAKKRPLKQSRRARVIVELPPDLLQRTDSAAAELSLDRSKLIRSAVEDFLQALAKSKLEQELAEGYRANAELDRQICEEFKNVDGESFR